MKVNVVYLTTFREIVGRRSETVELPDGSTLMDLLETLAERSQKFRKELFNPEGGEIRSYNKVALNGIYAEYLNEKFATKLREGDKILIAQGVSGG